MILSMTGYGDAEASHGDASYTVEIRSFNHRYFKVMMKMPENYQQFEPEIEKQLRSRLGRGSINYQLKVRSSPGAGSARIDTAVLKSYLDQIIPAVPSELVRIDLSGLLALPGVYGEPDEPDGQRETIWQLLSSLSDKAVEKLISMRREEGRAIARDLQVHTVEIRKQAEAVVQRAPAVVVDYRDRLASRVNELLKDGQLQVSQDDLHREIAVFADRCDISEEIARLKSHLDQFEELINSDDHAGRKLEFMTQEMLREANTMGSKANDSLIARHVVEMKGLIDRLKEQVQNVE